MSATLRASCYYFFSVTVWYNDEYCYYASVIVIMSVCSIVMDVLQTRGQEKRCAPRIMR